MLQTIVLDPTKAILVQLFNIVSSLAGVAAILLAGWLIALVIRTLILKGLKALPVDSLAEQVKVPEVLAKGGIKFTLSELIAMVAYWTCILVALVVAVNAAGLSTAAALFNQVVLFIPRVVAAVFILIAALYVAIFLNTAVQTAAANAGLAQAKLLGKIAESIVLVLALIMALKQINIYTQLLDILVIAVVASIGLGLGLAFGLGCKDIAGRFVGDLIERMKSKK